ncbi:MAG: DUF4256 domain-containing protein [Gallicola sp.]|nr:DUF4256 domain-containing protein [Gallicola sp.]
MKDLVRILEKRFEENLHRHKNILWQEVEKRLQEDNLSVLKKMEDTGGEPDVIGREEETGLIIFCDCSIETPLGRRKTTYDLAGEEKRNKKGVYPDGNALTMARDIGIELLDEKSYRWLQTVEKVDLKSSSWLKTPEEIRKLGGALFGDRRYDHVFIYHNGAESFYSARGFRGILKV